MTIRELAPSDTDALTDFFGGLSERGRTFIREDLPDRAAIDNLPHTSDLRWSLPTARTSPATSRWNGCPAAQTTSANSDSSSTRADAVGVGRALAQHALAAALRAGIRKVVVELAVDQERAIAMFSGLGFTGEALLRDQIRDRDGDLHDLVLLAHLADKCWSTLDAVGLADGIN